jgi:hypothetical protein
MEEDVIGGVDTVIPLHAHDPTRALERLTRELFSRWPSAVAEDAEGRSFSRPEDVPFSACCDLFVYKDNAVRQVWNALGATPEGEAAMVHLIATDTSITLVTGPIDIEETRGLVTDLSRLVDAFVREVPHAAR